MRFGRRSRLEIMLPALLGIVLLAESARAQDELSARLAEVFVYDDGVAMVRAEIGRVSEDIVDASLAVPEGFRVEGPLGGARRTTSINGVTRTVVEIGFRVIPPPGAHGEFEIGPVTFKKRSGAVTAVPVGRLQVGRRPEQGVRIEVEPETPGGPVLMPFVARYRVLYSGQVDEDEDAFGSARNPLGLTSLSLPVLGQGDVKIGPGPVPAGDPAGTVRLEDQALRIYRGHREVDGTVYRTLEFALEITPLAPGPIDLSATVGMSLVTGSERRKDFFGRIVEVPVAEVRRASTGVAAYLVEELPAEGRPKGFTGAVGRFDIEADPQPREVNAFDPIEVGITIRGRGLLERLALPRWSEFPEIARDFEVDPDLDPGEVVGDARVFKLVFRARSSAVRQFPSLPFPYYDPFGRTWRIAHSAPAPIVVRDVKTVRPDEAVGAQIPVNAAEAARPATIGRRLGIGANFDTLNGDAASGATSRELFTPGFLILLLAPPGLYVALTLLERSRSRAKDVPKGTPLSRALQVITAGSPPDAAAEIFAGYFRERADLPAGEVTTAELERALTARGVRPEVIHRVTMAHSALIAARFAGGEAPTDLPEVLREVDGCLG